ncbi:hypothetical protein AG0111_0g12508 [Alternaria gaisen]|uniref:Uncharacterized protein n=1 Tax=Alternaria gaisen TaxID=167740 RepID=A0ACB6F4D8_9PLEO|nr:hypothetical protein AG0111_0g12508 [Alternaria gaisen]
MSLPVRPSSATQLDSSHDSQSTTTSPIENTSESGRERTTIPPDPEIPNKRAKMSHSRPNSPSLSSAPSYTSEQTSPVAPNLPSQTADTAIPSIEKSSSNVATNDFLPQTQQALASMSAPESMTAPTSNMGAKRAPKQSPKRAREEEDDEEEEEEAFGTPPPKKSARKAKRPASSKTATKKAAAPKTSAPKKPAKLKNTPAQKPTAAPPLLPSSRPSRTRKAPERFEDFEEKTTSKALPAKKGASKVFDPVYITTNSSSRLVKADVYHMLLESPAWNSLTPSQQSTLISMLPESSDNVNLLAKISAGETVDTRPAAFTLANNCFRTDVAKFQEDLKNGHLAKTWQAAAEQAVVERAAGEYDGWKAEEAEAWWGQKGM